MGLIGRLQEEAPLFHGLDDDEVEALIGSCEPRSLSTGEVFCRMGDDGVSLAIIRSGRILVTRPVRGEDLELATLGPGDTFGEVAVATGGQRTADLTATEPSEVLEIMPDDLERAFSSHPAMAEKFWRNMSKVLGSRINKTNNMVAEYFNINQRLVEDPEFLRFYSQL
jgi:CRP-like cAMP-binding protein